MLLMLNESQLSADIFSVISCLIKQRFSSWNSWLLKSLCNSEFASVHVKCKIDKKYTVAIKNEQMNKMWFNYYYQLFSQTEPGTVPPLMMLLPAPSKARANCLSVFFCWCCCHWPLQQKRRSRWANYPTCSGRHVCCNNQGRTDGVLPLEYNIHGTIPLPGASSSCTGLCPP